MVKLFGAIPNPPAKKPFEIKAVQCGDTVLLKLIDPETGLDVEDGNILSISAAGVIRRVALCADLSVEDRRRIPFKIENNQIKFIS